MPALPPVPGALKISFQHTINGVPAFVHWYARYSGSPPLASDAATLANSIKSLWVTNIAPLVPTTTILTLVQVTDLSSPTGGQGNSGTTAAGTRAGSSTLANDCMLMNLKIGRRYRGGKPRQYWPGGITTDVLDAQHWTSTFQTSWNTAWNAMNTGINAATWTGGNITGPANISYYSGFTVVTSPTTGRARNAAKLRSSPLVDAVLSATSNARVATQRRREHFSA